MLELQFWALWIVLAGVLLLGWTVMSFLFAFAWGSFCRPGQGPERSEAGVDGPGSDFPNSQKVSNSQELTRW